MEKTKTSGRVSGFIRYTLNISSKQLWLLVLWSVFLMFVFPITMSMNANSYTRDISDRISYMMTQITTMLWYILPIPAFVFSHGFGYLNSRSKLDFYHSQPVTRTKLFAANYLNGLLLFLIPLAVMMPAGLVAGFTSVKSLQGGIHFHNQYGVELSPPQSVDFSLFYFALLYTFLLFFVFYSLAVLCRMLCGNTVIAMLVFCFIYVLPTLLDLVVDFYFDRFSTLFVGTGSGSFFELFAPLRLIISLKDALEQAGGRISFALGGLLAAVCALGAVCLLLAAFLYRFRRSEKAGAAVAIRGVVPVVKYPLVTVMILFAGFVFFNLSNGSLFWEISGYVLFGLLAFMLVNVLEKFDFRNILASLWKSVFCFAAAALFVGGVYAYAGYYDSVPDAQDVSEADILSVQIYDARFEISMSYSEPVVIDDGEAVSGLVELLREAEELGWEQASQFDADRQTYVHLTLKLDAGVLPSYKSYGFYINRDDSDGLAALMHDSGLVPPAADAETPEDNLYRVKVTKNETINKLFFGPFTAEAAQALAKDIAENGCGSQLKISISGPDGFITVYIDDGGAFSEYMKKELE